MSDTAFQSLALAMRHGYLSKLRVLSLQNTQLNERKFSHLCNVWKDQKHPQLKRLIVSGNQLREKDLQPFTECIEENCLQTLEELDLSRNRLKNNGIELFLLASRKCKWTHLTTLWLDWNAITPKGLTRLYEELLTDSWPNLKELHVDGIHSDEQ